MTTSSAAPEAPVQTITAGCWPSSPGCNATDPPTELDGPFGAGFGTIGGSSPVPGAERVEGSLPGGPMYMAKAGHR